MRDLSPNLQRPTLYRLKPMMVWMAASLALLITGCPQSGGGSAGGVVIGEGENNHLQDAVSLLPRLADVDPERGARTLQYHLERWYGNTTPAADWRADPLFERLPQRYDDIKKVSPLDGKFFSEHDAFYLRECFWARETSDWVVQTPTDPSLARWTTSEKKPTGDELFLSDIQRTPLQEAVQLFDWSVRNIRLEELLEYPPEQVGPQAAGDSRPQLAAQVGAAGPGYTLLPWQSMLFGRGDFWQRSRVFIQLLRQCNIDSVMIAIDEGSATGRATPWAVGVLVNDDIYLFDSRIGLPIPGPDGRGIATLAQVRKDPSILKQCDITSGGLSVPYRIGPNELRRTVLLIDAPVEALSQRMATLEAALTGADRLVLTVSPSAIAKRLAKMGEQPVRVWRIPIEATLYRNWFITIINRVRYAEDRSRLPAALLQIYRYYQSSEMTFRNVSEFAHARDLHLRGIIENQPDRDGAKIFYLAARVPDSVLNEIPNSVELQQQLGIYENVRQLKDPQAQKQRLRDAVIAAKRAKELCNQFLTLVQFDQGNYDAAVNWAERAENSSADLGEEMEALAEILEGLSEEEKAELLKQSEEQRNELLAWSQFIHARALESQGKIVDVKVLLRQIDSPQKEGNYLRAQWAGREPGQSLSTSAADSTDTSAEPQPKPVETKAEEPPFPTET